MRVIKTRAEVGDDGVLHVGLPDDAPTGLLDVLVVLEPRSRSDNPARRRAAARAGRGALRELHISSSDLSSERHEDERRRELALGQ